MNALAKSLAKALALAALAVFAAAPAGAQPASAQPASAPPAAPLRPALADIADARVLAGAERAAALTAASAALNATSTLQGRFRQMSPDGARAVGAFYLQRPGRLRFEYDAPATLTIVASGGTISMRDRELRTTERTTVSSTPLQFLLKPNINLARDARVTRVARDAEALLLTLRDRSGAAEGEITLRLEGEALTLRSWEVVDATGAATRIWLSEITRPERIEPRLFRLEDVLGPARPGPR